jgi:hypothetical protein
MANRLLALAYPGEVLVQQLATEANLILGRTDHDERDRTAVIRRMVQRLEKLGCTVSLEPTVQAA